MIFVNLVKVIVAIVILSVITRGKAEVVGSSILVQFDVSFAEPSGPISRTFTVRDVEKKDEDGGRTYPNLGKDVRRFCETYASPVDRLKCISGIITHVYKIRPDLGRVRVRVTRCGDVDFRDPGTTEAETRERARATCSNVGCSDIDSCETEVLRSLGYPVDTPPKDHEKLILMWTPIFRSVDQYEGNEIFSSCSYSSCRVTYDKSHVERADALVFWCVNLPTKSSALPTYRHERQRWIYGCNESPLSLRTTRPVDVSSAMETYVLDSFLTDAFNLTMTYDTSAWYFSGTTPGGIYGMTVSDLLNPSEKERTLQIPPKTRLVAWVASNCHSASGREHYVRALMNYVDVDVFGAGACAEDGVASSRISRTELKGTQSKRSFADDCPHDTRANPDTTCVRRVLSRYKFYFAFENSVGQARRNRSRTRRHRLVPPTDLTRARPGVRSVRYGEVLGSRSPKYRRSDRLWWYVVRRALAGISFRDLCVRL